MLRKSPLYAYFPAADLDRARRFYEETLDNAGTSKASEGNILAIVQSLSGEEE